MIKFDEFFTGNPKDLGESFTKLFKLAGGVIHEYKIFEKINTTYDNHLVYYVADVDYINIRGWIFCEFSPYEECFPLEYFKCVNIDWNLKYRVYNENIDKIYAKYLVNCILFKQFHSEICKLQITPNRCFNDMIQNPEIYEDLYLHILNSEVYVNYKYKYDELKTCITCCSQQLGFQHVEIFCDDCKEKMYTKREKKKMYELSCIFKTISEIYDKIILILQKSDLSYQLEEKSKILLNVLRFFYKDKDNKEILDNKLIYIIENNLYGCHNFYGIAKLLDIKININNDKNLNYYKNIHDIDVIKNYIEEIPENDFLKLCYEIINYNHRITCDLIFNYKLYCENFFKNVAWDDIYFPTVCIKKLKQFKNAEILDFLNEKLVTKEIYDELLTTKNPEKICIKNIPNRFITDELLNLCVFGERFNKHNYESCIFKKIPKICLTKEKCIKAIKINCRIMKYVPVEYIDAEFCKELMKTKNPEKMIVSHIPENFITQELVDFFINTNARSIINSVPKKFITQNHIKILFGDKLFWEDGICLNDENKNHGNLTINFMNLHNDIITSEMIEENVLRHNIKDFTLLFNLIESIKKTFTYEFMQKIANIAIILNIDSCIVKFPIEKKYITTDICKLYYIKKHNENMILSRNLCKKNILYDLIYDLPEIIDKDFYDFYTSDISKNIKKEDKDRFRYFVFKKGIKLV